MVNYDMVKRAEWTKLYGHATHTGENVLGLKFHTRWCIYNTHTLAIEMPNWIGINIHLLEVLSVANGTGAKDPNFMTRVVDLIAIIIQVPNIRGNLIEDFSTLRARSKVGLQGRYGFVHSTQVLGRNLQSTLSLDRSVAHLHKGSLSSMVP